MAVFQIKVNGRSHAVDVLPDTPLLWVLRDNLHLTGTKFGCGMAQCGACTIFLDGQPLRSCSMSVSDVGASEITTIEGLTGREADAVKRAWIAGDVPQWSHLDPGLAHGNEEIGDSLSLGNFRVCPGEQYAEVGQVGPRAPDLLTVDPKAAVLRRCPRSQAAPQRTGQPRGGPPRKASGSI